jgi:hypothetical protein
MVEQYRCPDCPIPVDKSRLCLFALVVKLNYTANYWVEGMADDEVFEGTYDSFCLADLAGREVEEELADTSATLGLPYDSGYIYSALSEIEHNRVLGFTVVDCINKKLTGTCPIIIT